MRRCGVPRLSRLSEYRTGTVCHGIGYCDINLHRLKEGKDETMSPAFLNVWTPRALALLRIVTAYLFIQHGTAKLLGVPHVAMFDGVQLFSLTGLAGILEIVGGALVLVGLFTRPAAFICSGEMAVAYFMAHASRGSPLAPMLNQGELAVLYCFVFLFLSAAGAGAWSVDALRPKRPEPLRAPGR
jgi:putative oxidoreductase